MPRQTASTRCACALSRWSLRSSPPVCVHATRRHICAGTAGSAPPHLRQDRAQPRATSAPGLVGGGKSGGNSRGRACTAPRTGGCNARSTCAAESYPSLAQQCSASILRCSAPQRDTCLLSDVGASASASSPRGVSGTRGAARHGTAAVHTCRRVLRRARHPARALGALVLGRRNRADRALRADQVDTAQTLLAR